MQSGIFAMAVRIRTLTERQRERESLFSREEDAEMRRNIGLEIKRTKGMPEEDAREGDVGQVLETPNENEIAREPRHAKTTCLMVSLVRKKVQTRPQSRAHSDRIFLPSTILSPSLSPSEFSFTSSLKCISFLVLKTTTPFIISTLCAERFVPASCPSILPRRTDRVNESPTYIKPIVDY